MTGRLGSSFRDPSGFVYQQNGVIHRQVNESYRRHFDALLASGLYEALVRKKWLVRHEEVQPEPGAYRTLVPERVPYVSYPYEWCFGQLKDAALLTLDIQQESLARGLALKDASAFNVQFVGHRPVFIDTLSFEIYEEGRPWIAYRQFCQHFLAPLAVMAYTDVRLRRLLGGFIDGLPLDLAARLLPARTRWRPGLLTHVHLHARSQQRHGHDGRDGTPVRVPAMSKRLLVALVDGLRRAVANCRLPAARSAWGEYYEDTNYSPDAMAAKIALVPELVDDVVGPGDVVHDLGANTGKFSQLLARTGRYVVAHDIDEAAVERHYQAGAAARNESVLPLLLDLASPSPALGWALDERMSALDRLSGGTVVALALIHHLAIANNVPLDRLAGFFARTAGGLVIEFVPKDDSQVRRLLATREDIFPDYTREGFERAFGAHFDTQRVEPIPGTARTLYAMRRRR